MSDRAKALRIRCDAMRGSAADLSHLLRTAASLLRAGRLSLPADLSSDLREYAGSMSGLRVDLAAALPPAEAAAVSSAPSSFELFGRLLSRIEQTEIERRKAAERRDRARAVIDQLLRIECTDDPRFAPLESCRSGAREIDAYLQQADVLSLPNDAVELAEGRHPWCALIALVDPDSPLDDDRWGELHETVTTLFGRPLAAAVARGRLRLPPGAKPAPARPLPPEPKTTPAVPLIPAAPARPLSVRDEGKPAKEIPKRADPPTDRTAETTTARSEPPATTLSTKAPRRTVELDADADGDANAPAARDNAVIVRGDAGPQTPAAPQSTASTRRVIPSKASLNTVPAIAQAAATSVGRTRYEHIVRLIWKLVLEGRIGLAFHLSRCLEARSDNDAPLLPSNLLHALALSAQVRFPLGEMSRQLAVDFARLRTARPPRNDAEWAVAWQLLLTAATLRPALLAPTSNASAVLHGLRMIEGLSRLYNYAHRITIFGDQSQPLDVNTFKRGQSEQAWEYELELLIAETEGWCAQTPARRIRYQTATHCFLRSHWSLMRSAASCDPQTRDQWRILQTALERLHALLGPVRTNDVRQLQQVRGEADRLSDPAEVERIASGASLGRYITATDPSSRESLRVLIAEAVGLVRRWLRLHDSPPKRHPTAVPRRAEEVLEERRALQLRDEVLSRQDAVLRELKSVAERYSSAPILTSIACCCRTIEQIRRLFDPDAAVPTDEPDPRIEIHAELLRIPNLALNELWEPEATSQELENDILQLLIRGAVDWRAAFDARCDEGDHEATERLLQLDVWKSDDERDELANSRERRLAECQAALERDIASTRARVEEALSLGLIQEHDHDHFESEIAAVESASTATLRFPAWHRRLNEIREGIERRRQYEIQRVRNRFDELQLPENHAESNLNEEVPNDGIVATARRTLELMTPGTTDDSVR